jgi:hypothetical protein
MKTYNTDVDKKKIKAKANKIVTKPEDLDEEYCIIENKGTLGVYSYKLDSIIETKIDSFMPLGCSNDLLVFKEDSICMTDLYNKWVCHYMEPIEKFEEAICEFSENQIYTKSGKHFELRLLTGALIEVEKKKEKKKECLNLIKEIEDVQKENDYEIYGQIKWELESYFSVCKCDSLHKSKLKKIIEDLDLYPRFYQLNLAHLSLEFLNGDFGSANLESVEGADKESCTKLLHDLQDDNSETKFVPLRVLVELEKSGCIKINYP